MLSLVAAAVAYALMAVKVVVLAVLVALILASATRPLVSRLERRGWPSFWAAVLVFSALVLALGGVITVVVLRISDDLDELVISTVAGWQHLQELTAAGPPPLPVDSATVNAALTELNDYLTSTAARRNAISGLTVITEIITGTVLTAIVLFFFLKDGPLLWNFVLRWFTGVQRAKVAESGDRAVSILGGYVRGIAVVATVDATFIGLGLFWVGVPLVIPLTMITFLAAFVPIIGAVTAGVLAALVALVTQGPGAALIVLGIVIVVNQVEGNLLQPVIMGHTLSLHALVVLLALSVGALLGGVAGAVLAVPLTAVAWAVLQVWTTRYQQGQDPVLGTDPVSGHGVAERASRRHRRKYRRMRQQSPPPAPPSGQSPEISAR
ncbi:MULTISPECIES: AI-2E family transporter [Kocuria]|uniref:AI-2E family transporter n=1 Tax=Kocuria TaxID=57493 RepID=UPI000D6559E6|nr:AI-2E family transporter [Kocuria rosea]PWF79440.1 AI-2E family transporter [Kocuria rosea]